MVIAENVYHVGSSYQEVILSSEASKKQISFVPIAIQLPPR
jgi:hypothetical protein